MPSEPPKPVIDSGLESEIDDALGGLELGSPTGNTLPGGLSASTGETLARPGIAFSKNTEESTQSAAFVPQGLATERPASAAEPPPTLVANSPAAAGDHHEELESGELEDMEDANGALESTHASAKEDDIVIADDLAEELGDEPTDIKTLLDEEEEHTDAGGTAPPYRPGH